MTDLKLCVKCRHCTVNMDNRYWCMRDAVWEIDVVTGNPILATKQFDCHDERMDAPRFQLREFCGKEGRFWEPRVS